MKVLKNILQYKYLYLIIFIISIIYSLCYTNLIKFKSVYNIDQTDFVCIIDDYSLDDFSLKMNLNCDEKIIGTYYYKTKEEITNSDELQIGDKLKIKGKLQLPKNNTIPYLFNYKDYLYKNKIYYLLKISSFEKIESSKNLLYIIKNNAIKNAKRINNSYVDSFVLGKNNSINKEVINSYRDNGISHLFAISGLHVGIFSMLLIKILKFFISNKKLIIIIVFILLLIFAFITGFSASILRSILFFFILNMFKLNRISVKNSDILLLVATILMIINPFIIYDISFLLSFTVTYFLLNSKKLNCNYFINILYISTIAFISSFGLSVYFFSKVNFLSPIFNVIFVPIISLIVFPLSAITYFFPFLSEILLLITNVLESISLYLNHISFNVYFPYVNYMIVIFYYILLAIVFKKKSKILLIIIICLIIIMKYSYCLSNSYYVYFLDVGQGDSIFIKQTDRNILIDTGGQISFNDNNRDYSLANNSLIPFFRKIGVSQIDYLILTHGDYDHMGEAINLVINFKVEKVIFNCGEYNDLEKELIRVLEKKNIKYYSCIKKLNIDKDELYFLQTKEYDNENDNSNVIYTELNGYKFMFMGDASTTIEKEILDKYNLPNIDVLKVGHHGSRTSSSKEFINEISPKYSVISVGKNNRYGHPNKEVLDNLNASKVYRTDQDGSVMFTVKNNKLNIETCTP